MARKRHTPEQIIRMLRQAEVELEKGQTTVEVARKLEIAEQRYYRNPIEGVGGAQKPRRRVPTFASSGTYVTARRRHPLTMPINYDLPVPAGGDAR